MITRRTFARALGTTTLVGATHSWNTAASAATKPKIAWVFLGPIGDFGWTYQHDLGRKDVIAKFGDKIEATYVENVPEGADSERVISALAHKGYNLIFATSFGYMNPTLQVAHATPKTFFESCTGYKSAPNVGLYNIRFYEGSFVQGVIAGKMSKTGMIGCVGSIPVPEVVMGMNATLLGMQSVNPKAKLKFVFINSWYDPGKEGDAAKALLDQGCDMLFQYTDSPAPLQVSQQRGFKGFGGGSDMIKFAPSAQLTAAIDNWGPYYIKRVEALLSGTWKPDNVWGGFESGMLVMAPFRNMPDNVVSLAKKTEEGIRTGRTLPFSGEIKDQAGALKSSSGKALDDAQIASMNWLVEGVEGKLPT